jgi:hypothetical protein
MTTKPVYETVNYSVSRSNSLQPDLKHRFIIYDKQTATLVANRDVNNKWLSVYRGLEQDAIARVNELENK